MQVRQAIMILSIVVVLIFCGCAARDRETPWVDISEIHNQLVIDKKEQVVLDEVEQGADENASASPAVKNMSAGPDQSNPSLQSLLTPAPRKGAVPDTSGEGVLLNFDNADIFEVIQVIAEILDMDYIIDPQVKGVVNIRSGKKIPMTNLYEIFKKILVINGLDITKEGKYHYIYPAKTASTDAVYGLGQIDQLGESSRMVMQVVQIMHLSAADAVNLIKPYLSEKGNAFDLANLNTIFVVDFEAKVKDALSILAQLDISPLSSLNIRLVRINNAPLAELQTELTEVLTSLQINKQGHEGVTVLPLERVNSLLLVSNNEQVLNSALRWIQELDVVPSEGRDNIYIYNVRNSVASELGQLVSDLIGGGTIPQTKTTTPSNDTSAAANDNKMGAADKKEAASPTRAVKKGPVVEKKSGDKGKQNTGMRFAGEPTLIADDGRNVIIIRALPGDYSRIVKLLERLDNMPRQVLIEVLVAEVQLSDSWSMGVEWAMKESGRLKISHSDGNTSAYNNNYTSSNALDLLAGGAASGFTYGVTNSLGDAVAILNAIASDNEISVLSSPQIMVLNNETATVNVGDQVPIVTSENLNSVTTGGIDTRSIEYKDTGVILTVTPKINHDGIIILDIDQQVSSAKKNDAEGISSTIISSRSLKTKVAVRDGQTIFMGGLIENRKNNTQGGIPFLMKIPFLGWMFKYESDSTDKTELLVMITPYVIDSESIMDQYINSFQEKMTAIRKNLNPSKAKPKKENKQDNETVTD